MSTITKRIHISGLPPQTKAQDLQSRFSSFGTVSDIHIPLSSLDNSSRNFGFFTIQTTEPQLKKCITVYNGTKWKGSVVKIQEAKKGDYMNRLKNEWEEEKKLQESGVGNEISIKKKVHRKRKKGEIPVYVSRNTSLVDDDNVDGRKFWKRGRYGRAIASMRLKRPNGERFFFDPTQFKENLVKLFVSARPKSVRELTWSVEERYDLSSNNSAFEVDSDSEEESITNDRFESMEIDHSSDMENLVTVSSDEAGTTSSAMDSSDDTDLPAVSEINKNQSEQQRLLALEARRKERQQQRQLISESLSGTSSRKEGHLKFSDSESEEEISESLNTENKEFEEAKMALFDSDEDSHTDFTMGGDGDGSDLSDDDNQTTLDSTVEEGSDLFAIKSQFEGTKGKRLLDLQRRFKGDDRFKITEDFDSSDSESEYPGAEQRGVQDHGNAEDEVFDECVGNLKEEKKVALNVLEGLFGSAIKRSVDAKEEQKKRTPSNSLSSLLPMVRYDPTAEDADEYEEEEQQDSMDTLRSNDALAELEVEDISAKETAIPEVSKDKSYTVNLDFGSVFKKGQAPVAATNTSFSLFGGTPSSTSSADDTSNSSSLFNFISAPFSSALDSNPELSASASMSADTPQSTSSSIPQSSFFLLNRLDQLEQETGKQFQRSETVQEIEKKWLESRRELTLQFKKKRKDAVRRERKTRMRKGKSN